MKALPSTPPFTPSMSCSKELARAQERGRQRMLKDITLGQFFPGDTLAHRLDPRTKLLVTVSLHRGALSAPRAPLPTAFCILTLIVAVRISRVGAKALFKGLKPVLFIIAFTALLNLFYTPGTELCALLDLPHYDRGCACRHHDDAAHHAFDHGNVPAHVYDLSHPPDGRSGEPAGPAQEAQASLCMSWR